MLLSCAFAAVLYGLALVDWAVLTHPWMLIAGEISYSIYLFQMIVFRVAVRVARRYLPSGRRILRTMIG